MSYFTDEDAPFLKKSVHENIFILLTTDVLHSFSIANVLLQSGSSVPGWMLKLPKPSKMKRRQMGKVKRAENVNAARKLGRNDAVKKRYVLVLPYNYPHQTIIHTARDMIAGSKRRKHKAKMNEAGGDGGAGHDYN